MRQVLLLLLSITLSAAVSITTVQASDVVKYETGQFVGIKKGSEMGHSSLNGTFAWTSQGSNFWKAGTYISTIKYLDSGTITFNGTGGCTVSGDGESYEVSLTDPTTVTVSSDPFIEPCTYTVAPDGAVQLSVASTTFWLSAGGNVLTGGNALTSTESNGVLYETDQLVLVKKGTGLNTSSLTGAFAFTSQGSFFYTNSDETYIDDHLFLHFGTITFNGTGGCSVSVGGNEYTVSYTHPSTVTEYPETGSASCTYIVASDGAVQVDFGDGVEDWLLSADGNVLTGGKAVTSTELDSSVKYETGQFVGVKKGTGLNTSSLTGAFAFNNQGSLFITDSDEIYEELYLHFGTITFNGTGGCSVSVGGKEYEVSLTHPSTVTEFPETGSGSCTYIVASDGAVQVDFGDGVEDWLLSADGNVLTGGKAVTSTEIIPPLLTGGIFSENRVYSEFFTNNDDYYEMRGWARSDVKILPVYAQNIPHSSGPRQVGMPYLSQLDLLSPPNYTFSTKFSAGVGFSLPGTDWEGGTFPIYIDENENGTLELGETSIDWTIPEGSLQQLSIPEVSITGRLNPTITWQKVLEAERYNIRLWTVTEENGLGDLLDSVNINANGSTSYSYTYDGDLFSQYSTLAVTVMANDTDSGFYNRSTYVTTHSTTVNLSGVMLLLLD